MRRRVPDLLIIALMFALPLVLFWGQTVGGRTLLPSENIYQYVPFNAYREQVGAPAIPHNALLSDLVLQNYQWKHFIRDSFAGGEVPLWNPHQFSGIPFYAAGQQSTLYPFSVLYYVLPLSAAYGWFTVSQLWLAGVFMYLFVRGLGVGRLGGAVAGVTYQLSAFFVISAVFPMIIAAAVWLPLLLLMAEFIITRRPALRGQPATVPWVAVGAVALGCVVLAGHVEITYYTLLILAYYAAARLAVSWWGNTRRRSEPAAEDESTVGGFTVGKPLRGAVWLAVMVTLGLGLGAVQFVPLFEVASSNFRSGSASYAEVIGWAHPARDLVQFALPNFYGNPSHHTYVDVFTGETVPATVNALGQPITTIDWGIKNYVEGALYLGILPLALAVFAIVSRGFAQINRPMRRFVGTRSVVSEGHAPTENVESSSVASPSAGSPTVNPYKRYDLIFAILALMGLSFMFGAPTYALLYYTLPGIDQLHSPFRWVFAVTLSVAVLAGIGVERLTHAYADTTTRRGGVRRWFGIILTAGGALLLVALVASRVLYPQVDSLVERVLMSLAKAPEAFADARMFYSYQFTNVLVFGVMTLLAGAAFLAVKRRGWGVFVVLLIAVDQMIASWGFNPASDPALLDYTPPEIAWLQDQAGDWRYTTLDDPSRPPILNANLGMMYGLDDVRGYESIISRQYVDYMRQLAPQNQLPFNRVAPLFTHEDGLSAADSTRLDALNVRYLLTHPDVDLSERESWRLAQAFDTLLVWENLDAFPRAYVTPTEPPAGWDAAAVADIGAALSPAVISADTGREKRVAVTLDEPGWLVISETYAPGWRAFIREQGAGENAESPLTVTRVLDNFQGVAISEAGAWTIRLVYSPQSIQLGGFASFISAVLIVFAVGVWLWRLFITVDDDSSTTARVAKNSLVPIILNLFNRGIDFAFAVVMLRILGPVDAGIYYYAIIIFGWFDIFTNFGLNLFLTREVARDRAQAGRYLLNTSVLRLGLAGVGVPLVLAFLAARQSFVTPPLTETALLAIGLLYVGLLPNSLSTGLSALFYAFEQAEIPAAVATAATIVKVTLGVLVLVLGFGVVGLAAVSIVTNLVTLALMWLLSRGVIAGTQVSVPPRLDFRLVRGMVRESYPLMLNHFLAQIFFQIDIVLIEAIHTARMVGQYSVAYKWVLALNIIPAFFTQALLPVMSRQAQTDVAALERNYRLAVKLLVMVALPTAVLFTFLAEPLTFILGGAEFLPDGAIALQLMIWSIPIGWMNSLTQYVLIALDLQRRITGAFIVGVVFNVVTNLVFIPVYGYRAAALTTIASELVLLVAFTVLLRSAFGWFNWLAVVWRPLLAALVMLVTLAVCRQWQPAVALLVGLMVYPAVLLALRPFSPDERARLLPLLPARLRRLPLLRLVATTEPN